VNADGVHPVSSDNCVSVQGKTKTESNQAVHLMPDAAQEVTQAVG
jgi:hypothetical protein